MATIAEIVYTQIKSKMPSTISSRGNNTYIVFENVIKRCTCKVEDNTIYYYRQMNNDFKYSISLSDPDGINKASEGIYKILIGEIIV